VGTGTCKQKNLPVDQKLTYFVTMSQPPMKFDFTSNALATRTTSGSGNPSFKQNPLTLGRSPSSQPPEEIAVPPEIAHKTVKAVLDDLEAQLEKQSREFQRRAGYVARWDRSIFECLELLQHLDNQIKDVETAKQNLERSSETLLREQEELIQTLATAIQSQTEKVGSGSEERKRLYQLAHDLGEQFLDIENQMKGFAEGEDREPSSDADKVREITNCHLDSMRWLVGQCLQLEEQLDKIQRRVPGNW
jgi:chromosome segregation ATPase